MGDGVCVCVGGVLIVNTIHKIRFIVSVFGEVKVGMTRDVLSVMKLW